MREVLFKTIHGSHLYGLATPTSDIDYFTVVTKAPNKRKKYAKQSIVGSTDSNIVDLSTFMVGLEKGVPQYWEAAFSQVAEVNRIEDFLNGLRAGTRVLETYYRTIKSFALAEGYKTKRHALRLAFNARDIGRYGRFNPTLDEDTRRYISYMAHKSHEDVYGLAMCWAWE